MSKGAIIFKSLFGADEFVNFQNILHNTLKTTISAGSRLLWKSVPSAFHLPIPFAFSSFNINYVAGVCFFRALVLTKLFMLCDASVSRRRSCIQH